MLQLVSISSGLLVYYIISLLLGRADGSKQIIKNRLLDISNLGNVNIYNETEEKNVAFNDRFLKPFFEKAVSFIGTVIPINETSLQKIAVQLMQAGIKKNAKDYISGNIVITLFFGAIGFLIAFFQNLPIASKILYFFTGLLLGYTMIRFHLKASITKRKTEMENALPEVLDLLSICVEAGLAFDQALQYVIEKCEGQLIEEFSVVEREIALGRKRSDALKKMADRCDIDDLRSFVGVIIQADELGFSIKNVLKMQADAIRQSHKQKIEEKAMKIPIKILFPLVMFIFPVIFIVLLGPAIPSIMSSLKG